MEQEIINQKRQLEMWLIASKQLETKLFDIKYVTKFEDENGICCTIFKFQQHFLGKWYLGIVSDSGIFSEMTEFDLMSATDDAKELLKKVQNMNKKEETK